MFFILVFHHLGVGVLSSWASLKDITSPSIEWFLLPELMWNCRNPKRDSDAKILRKEQFMLTCIWIRQQAKKK